MQSQTEPTSQSEETRKSDMQRKHMLPKSLLKIILRKLKQKETTQDIDTGTGVTAEKDLHVGVLTREVIVKVM